MVQFGMVPRRAAALLCALLATQSAAMPRSANRSPKREASSARQRRFYDRGCLFSPEGRIYQVEYASKAVERGSFAVGVLGPRGVALAAVRSAGLRATPEPLLSPNWCERVHRVDERIWCVACGVVPDATTLLRALREFAAEHRKTWGEAPPVEVVAKQLSRHAQKLTQRAGGRPFGAAFLLAGFDDGSDVPRLFKTDPGGTYEACEAGGFATAGAAPDDVLDALDAADLADADGAALQRAACAAAFDAAVASPPRGRDGARASDVEVCALDAAGGRFLKDDEVRALFDAREKSREAPE